MHYLHDSHSRHTSTGSADLRTVANNLLGAFSIATLVAFVFGIVWIRILARFHDMPFGYLLTVAITFMLYATVEFTGGNGAISSFVFGLILGNFRYIARFLRIESSHIPEERIQSFNKEVSFFVRTFFFLYLGLIFDPSILDGPTIFISLAVLTAAVCARLLSVAFISRTQGLENCSILLVAMMPRGLAAAVLASSLEITDSITDVDPKVFSAIVIMIILFTNVIATVGSFSYERRRQKSCGTS
ncbi:MAG: cation:proton antiporter [Candidatus Altiarchaeota archaeon]|nr:cation:proton antiporter [Candidatus Altiarchaeota archaeon]